MIIVVANEEIITVRKIGIVGERTKADREQWRTKENENTE